MNFLDKFIKLSIQSDTDKTISGFDYQTYLLDSVLDKDKDQDAYRDYIYRVNKACECLSKTIDKSSFQYYDSIYWLAKGLYDAKVSSSCFSEIKDKEYFDKTLEKIGSLLTEFTNNNSNLTNEYNHYLLDLEIGNVLSKFILSEESKIKIAEINQEINSKSSFGKKHRCKKLHKKELSKLEKNIIKSGPVAEWAHTVFPEVVFTKERSLETMKRDIQLPYQKHEEIKKVEKLLSENFSTIISEYYICE